MRTTAVLWILFFSAPAIAFNPVDTNNRCDYVLLTHDSLYSEASLLHNHRNTTLRSCLVRLSEVDSIFPGASVVEKIRNFVIYAYKYWKVTPTYLLLVGDANMTDSGSDLIPAPLVYNNFHDWEGNRYFANDGFYVNSSNPEQKKPIMHLGRLPARTTSELANAIDKLIYYDGIAAPPAWLQKVLMLVGDKNVNIDNSIYRTMNDLLRTQEFSVWNPSNLTTIYSSNFPSAGWPANATSATRSAWNSGYGFVNGFGNTISDDIFVLMAEFNIPPYLPPTFSESLAGNSYLPVVFGGTCLLTYFYRDQISSIAEDLLFSEPDRGAIAVIGPDHVNDIIESYEINKTFTHKMLTEGIRNIGRLFSSAKGLFLAQSSQEIGHEILGQQFLLLGDPATHIKLSPLPPITNFINGVEIEDAPVMQDIVLAKSLGITNENVKVVHSEASVNPLLSDRMIRITMTDNPTGADYIEWKLQDLNLLIKRNMILSFWLNVVTSPANADRIAIDGNTTAGRIKDQSINIFDQHGVPLDAKFRAPLQPGWQFIYVDLSPIENQSLLDLRIRYETTSSAESGSFVAYVDEIRVEQNHTGLIDQEIINSSFENDKDANGTPDFWTDLFGITQTPNVLRRDNEKSEGSYSMLVYDQYANGQGAQQIFHSNIDIVSYSMSFSYFAPDATTFRVKIVNAETGGIILNNVVNASALWNTYAASFTNPTFGFSTGRLKVQILPLEPIFPVYIDRFQINPPLPTDSNDSTESFEALDQGDVSPNPVLATSNVNVRFHLRKPSKVALYVYNPAGRLVAYEPPHDFPRGKNALKWKPSSVYSMLPSGMYFIRLKVDGKFLKGRRVAILK